MHLLRYINNESQMEFPLDSRPIVYCRANLNSSLTIIFHNITRQYIETSFGILPVKIAEL